MTSRPEKCHFLILGVVISSVVIETVDPTWKEYLFEKFFHNSDFFYGRSNNL
jgi:hypothetical protein